MIKAEITNPFHDEKLAKNRVGFGKHQRFVEFSLRKNLELNFKIPEKTTPSGCRSVIVS